MKKEKVAKKDSLLTRAELINRSRSSVYLNKLPNPSDDMFDILRDFKQGTRVFVDLSKTSEKDTI